jgi:multidrug efflux pump subunit AcrA (membrane-fusion protein)
MFPGAFVEGTLTHGTERRSPSVPESAVISMGGEDVVFVGVGEGAFEVRRVEIGLSNDSRYEVLSGVDLDEQVVVQGVFFLKSALVKGGDGGE